MGFSTRTAVTYRLLTGFAMAGCVFAQDTASARLPDVVPTFTIERIEAVHRPTGCMARLEFSNKKLLGAVIVDPLCGKKRVHVARFDLDHPEIGVAARAALHHPVDFSIRHRIISADRLPLRLVLHGIAACVERAGTIPMVLPDQQGTGRPVALAYDVGTVTAHLASLQDGGYPHMGRQAHAAIRVLCGWAGSMRSWCLRRGHGSHL